MTFEQKASGEELFYRYQAGDIGAFEELVALYEDELARFLYGMVHDYHETKHLTIDAFALLAVRGSRFSGASSLKTYLFEIGKNLANRFLKMNSRAKCVSFDEIAEKLIGEDASLYDLMEREEEKKRLHDAMGTLKCEHRSVLILLYFEDMSYRQAGEVMGKSEKQIKSLAFRAKAALKRKFSDLETSVVSLNK